MATALSIVNSALIKLGQEKISSFPDTITKRGVVVSEQYSKSLANLLRKHPWNFADTRVKISVDEYDISYADVSTSDYTFTQAKHGYVTGEEVYISTSDTLPSPLAASTSYYVIKSSVNKFKLATSLANALAGTAIVITTQGVGTHTITPQNITPEFGYEKQIRLPSDWIAMSEVCGDSEGISNVEYKEENKKILSNYSTLYIRYTRNETDPANFPDDFAELLAKTLAADICYDILNSREKEDTLRNDVEREIAQVRFQDSKNGTHKPMQVNYFTRQRY